MKARVTLLFLAACSLGASACGGSGRAVDAAGSPDDAGAPALESLDAVLEPVLSEYRLPALGAFVLEGGAPVAAGMIGVRKAGDGVAAELSDRFHLGSCTKTMTATLMALLVEEGTLRWEMTLAEALPALADQMHEDYREVTLQQLLGHRGGMPGSIAAARPEVWAELWRATGSITEQRQWFAREMLEAPPEVTPGTYTYSNAGYMIAGAAMESATGASWESLLSERVFTPLEMSSCGFGAPASPGSVDQPWGHQGTEPVPPGPAADNPPALGPAGTVHCSLADWAKFVRAHLAGGRGEDSLLKAESFARLQTPSEGGYGLGWLIAEPPWAGGPALTHDGSNTMFYASVLAAPAKDLAFLVVINRGGQPARDAVTAVLADLIEAYAGSSG